MNKQDFVAYEYKNISVKRDMAEVYKDCLGNFGWVPVEERPYGFRPSLADVSPVDVGIDVSIPGVDGLDMVTLKFKRDSRIGNKNEIDRLGGQCEDALAAVDGLEKRKNARTMGVSLGTGIIGTAFIGLGVFNFMSANIVLGVIFTIIGIAGWGIGFFTNIKAGKKKATQSESRIQEQLNIAYNACEQAHALLA